MLHAATFYSYCWFISRNNNICPTTSILLHWYQILCVNNDFVNVSVFWGQTSWFQNELFFLLGFSRFYFFGTGEAWFEMFWKLHHVCIKLLKDQGQFLMVWALLSKLSYVLSYVCSLISSLISVLQCYYFPLIYSNLLWLLSSNLTSYALFPLTLN